MRQLTAGLKMLSVPFFCMVPILTSRIIFAAQLYMKLAVEVNNFRLHCHDYNYFQTVVFILV